jgi:hypothetical protein
MILDLPASSVLVIRICRALPEHPSAVFTAATTGHYSVVYECLLPFRVPHHLDDCNSEVALLTSLGLCAHTLALAGLATVLWFFKIFNVYTTVAEVASVITTVGAA